METVQSDIDAADMFINDVVAISSSKELSFLIQIIGYFSFNRNKCCLLLLTVISELDSISQSSQKFPSRMSLLTHQFWQVIPQ